ncbi:MAG: DUF1573 domain-containing protein [Planctomycetota bacterium]|jgi:hypothetical protein
MRFKYAIVTLISILCLLLFGTVVYSQKADLSTKDKNQSASPGKIPISIDDKKSGPTIKFESIVQDLGEVGTGSKKSCEYKFTNTGDSLLRIKKVSTSCGCTSPKLGKKEYAPGESGTLKITYHANKQPAKINKKAYVTSNDRRQPKVTLTINGQVVAKVEHDPIKLELMPRKDNAGCSKITLKSKDNKPFSIKRFKSTAQSISADIDPSTKKKQYIIEPKVNMEKISKTKNGNITIQLDHPQCKQVSIPFKVIPEFQTKPKGLTLLKVEPEQPVTRELWVLSNYNEEFEIESVTSQNGYAKATNKEKNGNRYKIDLEITPPKPTSKKNIFRDKILVKIKDGEKLEVSCYGVYPKKNSSKVSQNR